MAAPPSPGATIKLCWHDPSGLKQEKVLVSADDHLQKLIDHARITWDIPGDVALCLRKTTQNGELVGSLDRTLQAAGLPSMSTLFVDFADEESKRLYADKKQKAAAVAYQRNVAAHEKWRSNATPSELFRYDLKRHAQILDHTMKHANDEQLHRLFNTHGMLNIYNMLIGTFQVDPDKRDTPAVNLKEFQKFGRCADGRPFCSSAAREKYLTRWNSAAFTGDVPKYTPPPAAVGGVASSSPVAFGGNRSPPPVAFGGNRSPPPVAFGGNRSPPAGVSGNECPPHTPPRAPPFASIPDTRAATAPDSPADSPAAAARGGGPEFSVETLGGFGEIIRATKQKNSKPDFPDVKKGALIVSFHNIDLKHGDAQYFGCACDVVVAADDAGALVSQIICKKSASTLCIVNLQWLKKQSAASIASTRIEFVPISEALVPGSTSFSKLLKLDGCDLHVRFSGDAEVLLFEEAMRYLHGHFAAFSGGGHRLDDFKLPEDIVQTYQDAYGKPNSAGAAAAGEGPPHPPPFGEGLVFSTEDSDGSAAQAMPEENEFKLAMDDLRCLSEYNAYVTVKDAAMKDLKKDLEALIVLKKSQAEIDQKCKEIENLAVSNLESFNMARELRRWQTWQKEATNLRSSMWGQVAVKIDLLQKELAKRRDANARRTPTVSSADVAAQLAEIKEMETALRQQGHSAINIAAEVEKLKKKHEKLNSERVPFQYEDVLISVHFDGFDGAENYAALCPFPTTCRVSHVVAWLRHRVLDMGALVPAGDALPFTLHRLVLLHPATPISKVCSAPTSKVTCRLNLTESARVSRKLPFKVEPRCGQLLSASVRELFPALKTTPHEIERIQKLNVELKRKKDFAKFFSNDAAFKKADAANKPARWRLSRPDGKCDGGELACDELRSFLNRGHFDDASKFGALLSSFTFSFDGASYVPFSTHRELLFHINDHVLDRSLNAVLSTLHAAAAAAVCTWPETYGSAASASDLRAIKCFKQGDSGKIGCLSFELPLLQGVDPKALAKIFTDKMTSVDKDRASKVPKLPPLFSNDAISCSIQAAGDAGSSALRVQFLFPSFLSLDCVMRSTEGLQAALELMMFDFYFEQTKRPELSGAEPGNKCPICSTDAEASPDQ